jgi:CRP-like cAMP-binding protein
MEACLTNLKNVVTAVSPFTETAWKDFSSLFKFQKIQRGDYFCREGEFPENAAFVCKGVLRAFYRTEEGVEYNKTFFIENSFPVSLAAVLQRSKSYLNFQTLEDCELLVANYHKIEELYQKHRCIETFVRKILELEWVLKKEQRELRLVLNNAEQRYLFFQQEYPGLENRIPQYHIASHLGVTPIQLSRIRAKLAKSSK